MGLARRLLFGLLPTLWFGCASMHGQKVDDSRLVRLPAQDKQTIFAAQHNVDVAKANVESARVARDEARQFRLVSEREVDAVKARLDAGRIGKKLGQHAENADTVRSATRTEEDAQRQMNVARAKKDYADQLLTLREHQLKEQEAALKLAEADVEYTKMQALASHNHAQGINTGAIEDSRSNAQNRLAQERQAVAQLKTVVSDRRNAWDSRKRENTAARDTAAPSIEAPPPPAMAPTRPVPAPNP